jgi:hypothetical protein
MSWQTDREPIDYLRQRIKYYKKKQSMVKNLVKNPVMIQKYGEEELQSFIARRLLTLQSFMDMFKKAVKDLEEIEKTENEKN